MSMYEKEDVLFGEWEKQRENFVRDGVVCETAYLNSAPKILIVLKEPHGDNGGDIRNWLRNVEALDRTWDDVARWVNGIRKRTSTLEWGEFAKVTPETKTEILKSICAMNLKKSAGGSSADWGKLKEATTTDAKLIRRQYEIYNPDITICCGNSDLFKSTVLHNSEWQQTTRSFWWYEHNRKHIFSHCHPARPIETSLKFYPLIDAVNEVLDAG